MTARALPDRWWLPGAFGLVLALAFVGALLVRADGDVSLLVHAGPPWSDPATAPESLTVQAADEAFDGQFFYRLGVSPWSTVDEVAGVTYDLPALRNARWGYGALAWLASAGDPDLVPWALVGLNVAAAFAVGAIGGGLARSSGRHAAWGALLVLWPGFAYSLSMDTSELVASAFLLGGLLALRHRRWLPAGLLLTAAVLTRDTTAGVPVAVAAAGAWTWWSAWRGHAKPAAGGSPTHAADSMGGADGTDGTAECSLAVAATVPQVAGRPLLLAGGLPLVAFGGWQLLQRARFGDLPLSSSGSNNLSVPFAGLAEELGRSLPPGGGEEAFRVLCALGVLALMGAAAWCWRRTSAPLAERLAWLPAFAVVALLNDYLWSGATAFLRAATEVGVLSILLVLGSARDRLLGVVALGLGGFWLLNAAAQLSKLG